MSSEAHNWNEVAEKLRRALGLCPPTPDEADRAIREAGEIPMSRDEISSIVQSATSGELPPTIFHPDDSWTAEIDTGHMAEDSMVVMNRNRGDDDEEVDKQIDQLRREALQDDDDDQK